MKGTKKLLLDPRKLPPDQIQKIGLEFLKEKRKRAQTAEDLPELSTDYEQKLYSSIYKNYYKKGDKIQPEMSSYLKDEDYKLLMQLLSVYSALIYTIVFLNWWAVSPENRFHFSGGFWTFLFLAPVAVYLYI